MPISRFLLVLPSLIALAACGSDQVTRPGDRAELRLLHASPGLGSLDLDVAGQRVISGLPFGRSSALVEVQGGAQRLVIRSGTAVIGTIDGTLGVHRVNSVLAWAGKVELASRVDGDTGTVAPTRANLRFVITAAESQAAPTQLNALLSGTSIVPVDSTQRFGIDATVSRYWSLLYYDPGRFTVRFVPAGTNGPVLAQATFDVAAGETKAIVLRRDTSGTYLVEVVVEP